MSFLMTLFSSPSVIYGVLGALIVGEIALIIFLAVLWVRNRKLTEQLKTFFSGKSAEDLESVLLKQLKNTEELDREIQEIFEILNRLRALTLKSIHKTSIVRFNPFKEVGGNQSFCVALLDGRNSGMVISSLHTREGTRVYAKPVVNGGAENFPLTDEEKTAITQALQNKVSAAESPTHSSI
jgi:hypothetical protein